MWGTLEENHEAFVCFFLPVFLNEVMVFELEFLFAVVVFVKRSLCGIIMVFTSAIFV